MKATGEVGAPPPAGSTQSVAVTLPADPSGARRARDVVSAQCRAAGVAPDLCEVVRLLTSELVTNAVLHGRSAPHLQLVVDADRVRVEVTDGDPRRPEVGSLATDALGGRGIAIVDLLAQSWGIREEVAGKTVWFEVKRS